MNDMDNANPTDINVLMLLEQKISQIAGTIWEERRTRLLDLEREKLAHIINGGGEWEAACKTMRNEFFKYLGEGWERFIHNFSYTATFTFYGPAWDFNVEQQMLSDMREWIHRSGCELIDYNTICEEGEDDVTQGKG